MFNLPEVAVPSKYPVPAPLLPLQRSQHSQLNDDNRREFSPDGINEMRSL